MFAYTGLTRDMLEELKVKYSIYIPIDGRFLISGLNDTNINYVADAFHQVTKDKRF